MRDGEQCEGISLSLDDKLRIVERLDAFGIDFIEGGFPASNPKDIEFFRRVKEMPLEHARIAAFGSTCKKGMPADQDQGLADLVECGAPVATIVGKTWDAQVTRALQTTLKENIRMIADSVAYLKAHGLTVVFDAYFRKSFPERLIGPGEPVPMFAREVLDSTTDPVRAERVWKGLRKKLPRRLRNMLLHVWLSESVGADELLLRYMRKIFDSPERKSADFTDADVLAVHDIARTVSREAHHLIQFARLRKMADGSYYAPVSPKCNALPLAVGYFRDRFADQRWLVYDLKRRYGYAYDLHEVREVVFESLSDAPSERLTDDLLDADELAFQRLWKSYFDALAIPERFNPRLQRRQMPARFWKYLIEKE